VRGLFVDKKGACKNGDVSVRWCGNAGVEKSIRTALSWRVKRGN
jgi:hypothetical protein